VQLRSSSISRIAEVNSLLPMNRFSLCLILTLLPLGCTSLKPKTSSASFVGTEVIKELDSRLYLECVHPESEEAEARKLKRSSIDRSMYYSDKANRDRPTTLDIPTTYTIPADAFRNEDNAGADGQLSLVLQLRERRKILKAKVYQIRTSLFDENDTFVRKRLETEKYPRYYDWVWHPDCKVRPRRPIWFAVRGKDQSPGHILAGKGLLDSDGSITFNLQPDLDFGASSSEGLTIAFTCPEDALYAEAVIPQEVFVARRSK